MNELVFLYPDKIERRKIWKQNARIVMNFSVQRKTFAVIVVKNL